MDESSTLCMTQFDYQRTKETKLKATYTLVKIRSLFSYKSALRTEGREEGRRGGADWRDNSLQQMSTSLGGRAIKGKVLKAGDVRHVTQSTRNRVSLLTHQHGTNFYCVVGLLNVLLHSTRKETRRREQECG
jgi:hypothetical protein